MAKGAEQQKVQIYAPSRFGRPVRFEEMKLCARVEHGSRAGWKKVKYM